MCMCVCVCVCVCVDGAISTWHNEYGIDQVCFPALRKYWTATSLQKQLVTISHTSTWPHKNTNRMNLVIKTMFYNLQSIALNNMCRVGQNHIYTVYIRYVWQGNHQIYGHIRCIYTVLANPKYVLTQDDHITGPPRLQLAPQMHALHYKQSAPSGAPYKK